ncbi:hypothetical protein [Sphingomonas sp.]|uniref:hypothetical protein n=1 Tax=Sphingomonas sp. TaxID=28214 RepID=UPI0035BC327B
MRCVLAPALLGLALSGCNSGGASVFGSGSESAGSSSGLSDLWEKVKSLGVETGKTYEMPAVGIMADAFLTDTNARRVNLDAVPQLVMQRQGNDIPRFDRAIDGLIEPTRKEVATVPPAELAKVTPLDAAHMIYAGPIVVAMQPRKGWEVNAMRPMALPPEMDTPFFRRNRPRSNYDEQLHVRYMEMLAISAIYTNTVFGLIDKELGTSRLADPDAARRQVLVAFQSISADTLKAALTDATGQVVGGDFTTDLTGSGNIHFTHTPAGDFVADPRGLTWTKAGGIWFGDGRINGQAVNLRLASTASLSQRQAQSGTQGTNADAKVEGSGNIGPGR